MQDRPLIPKDVPADVLQGLEVAVIGLCEGLVQLCLGDAHRVRVERDSVEPPGVVKHGRESQPGDVATDSLDDLDRGQRFAESSHGPGLSFRADHIAFRAERLPQFGNRREGILIGTIDTTDHQRQGDSRSSGQRAGRNRNIPLYRLAGSIRNGASRLADSPTHSESPADLASTHHS